HLVLAVAHRVVETGAVAGGEPAQIEDLAGALETIAVASLAVVVVDGLPCFDRLILRRGCGRDGRHDGCKRDDPALRAPNSHASNSAKVHSETPVGAFSSAGSPARWA